MILLTQPRGRGTIGPGHAAFHSGDFFGDLTKLEKQGCGAFPRAHDHATIRLTTIDVAFEAVAQFGGQGA